MRVISKQVLTVKILRIKQNGRADILKVSTMPIFIKICIHTDFDEEFWGSGVVYPSFNYDLTQMSTLNILTLNISFYGNDNFFVLCQNVSD